MDRSKGDREKGLPHVAVLASHNQLTHSVVLQDASCKPPLTAHHISGTYMDTSIDQLAGTVVGTTVVYGVVCGTQNLMQRKG